MTQYESQRDIIDMVLRENAWTHRTKGGRYSIEDYAFGSGADHGRVFVIYKSLEGSLEVYARDHSEWHDKMVEVKP